MNILNLFKKPPAISAEEVKSIVENRKPDDYLMIDVRQPLEYEQGHIPGARLIHPVTPE